MKTSNLRSDSKLPPSNDVRVQKINPKVVFHQKRLYVMSKAR